MNRKLENIRFAIEIEVEFPQVKDSYDLIQKNRLIRGWELDFDGSLDNGAEYRPKDKNHLYFNEDCIDQIKEIIGLIKAHRGNIKPSCGFHCHIDTSKFKNEEIVNIVKAFYKNQDKIYKKFKVLKIREKSHTQKLDEELIKKLTPSYIEKVRKNEFMHDRHYGLNLDALNLHNTIEFRFFNGTIQPRKIKKCVEWTINFCLKNAKKETSKKRNN
jgi:hypothetical protein